MPTGTQQLVRMLDELGRVTDEPGRLTRTFLSPGMKRANALAHLHQNIPGSGAEGSMRRFAAVHFAAHPS